MTRSRRLALGVFTFVFALTVVVMAGARINPGPVNDPAMDGTPQDTQSTTAVAAIGNRVVVAFNDSGSNAMSANQFTGFASSSNTGANFVDHGTLPPSANGDAGFPVLARDNATGAFYLTTLARGTDDLVQFFKSVDGGQTFSPPLSATPGSAAADSRVSSWITVDNFAGPGQHDIYLCTTDAASTGTRIDFFRSTDQGATFGPPGGTVVSALGGAGCFVAVGPDHSVDVFYYRGTGANGQGGDNRLFMRRSTDQGLSFGGEHQVADLRTSSTDGSLELNGSFRTNSFPYAAVNPVSGDMVVVYNDDPNLTSAADNGDIFYVRSTDDGVSWSSPTRVNEVAANDQFFPAVSITPDGQSIMFGYYDRSQDPNNLWFHRQGRAGVMNTTSGAITLRHGFQLGPNTPLVVGQDPILSSTYMSAYDTIDATNSFFHTTWADNRDGNGFHADQPDVRYAQIATDVTNTDLGVTVTPTPSAVDLGQHATLAVNVTVAGQVAKDVFVSISPVIGLRFESVPGSCRLDAHFIGCSLGNMSAGTSKTLTIGVLGTSPGPRTVKASATTSSDDENQGDNTGTGTVTVRNHSSSTSQFSTGNIAVPIPDLGTVDIPIAVPAVGTVFKVQALVRLNHTFDADLDMFLIDPSAHVVELSTDNGVSGDNYGSGANDCSGVPTTFSDSAATLITSAAAPFAGAFRPEQPLEDLVADPGGGTWKLRVTDDAALDTGTIGCFTLKITHP